MKIVSTLALTRRRSCMRPNPTSLRTCFLSSNIVSFAYWLGAGISLACYPFLFSKGVELYRDYLKAGVIDCDALSPSGVPSYHFLWAVPRPDRYQGQALCTRSVLRLLPRRHLQRSGHTTPRLSS